MKPKSTLTHESTNPATDEVISEFPTATKEEARAAVEAASRAFKTWKDVPLRNRALILFNLRAKFEEHYDELCRILIQDHGRIIVEARGSVRRVIGNIESACSALYGMPKRN